MKNIFIVLFPAILFMATACDWVKPESLDYTGNGFDEHDGSAYLNGLKAYKESEHMVMILNMLGTSEYPVSQAQRLMAMPDSADYICIGNLDNLHPQIVKEISEVKEKKGTSVLSAVDFNQTYLKWLDYKLSVSDEGRPAPGLDECRSYFKTDAQSQLAYCSRYGFDGVIVSFTGTVKDDEELNSMEGFMEAVKDWLPEHKEKIMVLRGNLNLLSDKSIVSESRYVILVMGGASGVVNYRSKLRSVLRDIEEKDRTIFEISVPSSSDPEQKGDSPYDAAIIIQNPEVADYGDYKTVGLAVSNAYDDYYNENYYQKTDINKESPIYFGNYVNVRRGINCLAAAINSQENEK